MKPRTTSLITSSVLFGLVCLSSPCFAQNNQTSNPEAFELKPNQPIERTLKGGDTHIFQVNLKTGQFMHVKIEQSAGFDLIVSLSAPDGKQLVEMDGKNGYLWREELSCVADHDGDHQLRIKAYGAANNAGRYVIKVTELRPAVDQDKKLVDAEKEFAAGRQLYELGGKQSRLDAKRHFETAISLWRDLGDKFWEAVALTNLGWNQTDFGETDKAVASLVQASKLFQNIKDLAGEGKSVNGLGGVYRDSKQYEKARDSYERALAIRRALKDRRGEGNTLGNLAQNYKALRQYDKAQIYYEQSLEIAREVHHRNGEGLMLLGLGDLYYAKNEYQKAKGYYEQGLVIIRELKFRYDESSTLRMLGLVHFFLKEYAEAEKYLDQALVINQELKERADEGLVLYKLGDVYRNLFQYEKALNYFERTLSIARELKDRTTEATTLRAIGFVYLNMHQPEKAKDYYEQTLAINRGTKDRSGESVTLDNLGLLYSGSKQYEAARDVLEQALVIKIELPNRGEIAHTLNFLGSVYSSLRQYEKARKCLDEGLAIAREIKDRDSESYALITLGSIYSNLREIEKSVSYGEQALAIKRELKDQRGEGDMLGSLGHFYIQANKYEKALDCFERILAIRRSLNDRTNEGYALSNLALINIYLSRFEQLRSYSEQHLAIAREVKDPTGQRLALNGLGLAYSAQSQYEKAREAYEESLAIARRVKDRSDEGTTLDAIGGVYVNLSQYEKARDYHEQALAIAREVKNRLGEGGSLGSLGRISLALNEYEKARDYFEQSLVIARELKNRLSEGDCLINLGFVSASLNQYERAREYYEEGLRINKELKIRFGEVNPLLGFGGVLSDLSQYEKAADFYRQSLEIIKDLKDRRGEGITLNAVGTTYLRLKQYDKATPYFQQALAIAREVKNKNDEANALIDLGEVYLGLNQLGKARNFYEQGLALTRIVRSRAGECDALTGLGDVYQKSKQFKESEESYQLALLLAREIRSRKLEGKVLRNLMELENHASTRRLAIFYGKQAINAFQEIRSNIKHFEKESQVSYVHDKESAYRMLADLLIETGRLGEAERVLALLKEEEYAGLLRRNGETKSDGGYSGAEAEAIKVQQQLADIGRERAELRTMLKEQKTLDEKSKSRLDLIERDLLPRANRQFRFAMAVIEKEAPDTQKKTAEVKDEQLLMTTLSHLDAGTVALYTVISMANERTDKGWIILVTPDFRKAYSIDITSLDHNIAALREALSSPFYEPKPAAQKLYRQLFLNPQQTGPTLAADLEKYLRDQEVKTLMWSLDGVLRYLPMAALHDGEKYLVERYRNVVFTSKGLLALPQTGTRDWKVFGLAVSKEYPGFRALSGTPLELAAIVREQKNTSGVLPGVMKLNEEFTEKTMLDGLREDYQVVHIATHFKYDAADPTRSFLLLGDGSHLETSKFEDSVPVFANQELVTLSACDTATGGSVKKANGRDAEGLAYVAQELGAKSVIASLWPVDDIGTQVLMPRFYRLHEQGMSKAEAFQRAQLALLHGEVKDAPGIARSTELVRADKGDPGLPPYIVDPRKPFAHPYYWAPFILIGNWK